MPEFVFAYHGGTTPSSPEEGAKVMAQWKAWFDGMGDAVALPGAPVGMSKTVSSGVLPTMAAPTRYPATRLSKPLT